MAKAKKLSSVITISSLNEAAGKELKFSNRKKIAEFTINNVDLSEMEHGLSKSGTDYWYLDVDNCRIFAFDDPESYNGDDITVVITENTDGQYKGLASVSLRWETEEEE